MMSNIDNPYDINEEWIKDSFTLNDVHTYPYDNDYVFEYWNGETQLQPYIVNNCDDYFGYCQHGQCNGTCI